MKAASTQRADHHLPQNDGLVPLGRRLGRDYPELVVFDLDACLWDQEMFEMPALPNGRTEKGNLNGRGHGVVAVYSEQHPIRLHAGALLALQEHWDGQLFPGMRVALASSADTPLAVQIGRAALQLLEVVPKVTVWDVLMRDWHDQDVNQIGRQPPLSPNKAKSHFPRLQAATGGIAYDRMLFFDDCNWGDHCGAVERACVNPHTGRAVVTHRTPSGLGIEDWSRGMQKYAMTRSNEA